nr:hypothetical protein [Kibdelosporangium sp. MJ126-NF4]CTQ97060.1 hypothetical protein [Kibdelosporangium sp. MJ126-NF4]
MGTSSWSRSGVWRGAALPGCGRHRFDHSSLSSNGFSTSALLWLAELCGSARSASTLTKMSFMCCHLPRLVACSPPSQPQTTTIFNTRRDVMVIIDENGNCFR